MWETNTNMRERAHTHYTHLWAVTEHVAAGVVELVVQRNGLPIHVLKMCVCVCVCVCVWVGQWMWCVCANAVASTGTNVCLVYARRAYVRARR